MRRALLLLVSIPALAAAQADNLTARLDSAVRLHERGERAAAAREEGRLAEVDRRIRHHQQWQKQCEAKQETKAANRQTGTLGNRASAAVGAARNPVESISSNQCAAICGRPVKISNIEPAFV